MRSLVYFGHDGLHFAFLQSHFPEIATVWHTELLPDFALENWNRIHVIDMGARGRDLLLQLKQANAGLPAILFMGRDDFPLAQITGSFVDGAEAMFSIPLHRPADLIDCIRDCCKRLDQWQSLLCGKSADHAQAYPPATAPRLSRHDLFVASPS